MEESLDDYNLRLLVVATQYFYEHFKVRNGEIVFL